jgi:hypothetical protein
MGSARPLFPGGRAMKNTSHLTPGYAPTLAMQIAKMRPGQAHWAGSGPPGRTCADCDHLGYWRKIQDAAGNVVSTRQYGGCGKFFVLTNRHGPIVSKSAEACRHFTPRTNEGEQVIMSTGNLKIISADERLAEKSGPKILLVGPSGVGKTSLLRTLSKEMLASTLVVDIEAGLSAVDGLQFASVRPRTWNECGNLACVLGGFNPALPASAAYSEAHYNEVMKNPELAALDRYSILFVDSVTAASRLCFAHCEQSPEAFTDRGKKDLRAVYGQHGRTQLGWFNQFQHARERTVIFVAVLEKNTDELNISTWQPQIEGAKTGRELPAIVDEIITMQWVDFGDRKPTRAFVCTNPNPWGYPAKDRSGKLEQFEPPNLGALIEKLTSPGQRKPFNVVSPEQHAQN